MELMPVLLYQDVHGVVQKAEDNEEIGSQGLCNTADQGLPQRHLEIRQLMRTGNASVTYGNLT